MSSVSDITPEEYQSWDVPRYVKGRIPDTDWAFLSDVVGGDWSWEVEKDSE